MDITIPGEDIRSSLGWAMWTLLVSLATCLLTPAAPKHVILFLVLHLCHYACNTLTHPTAFLSWND